MIEILTQEINTMQNVYTPLPMKMHFIFCIIATVVYLLQYARKNAPHYLVIMVAVDLTFVTQICTKSIVIGCLFGAEVILLSWAAVLSYRYNKKLKAQNVPDTAENGSGDGKDADE